MAGDHDLAAAVVVGRLDHLAFAGSRCPGPARPRRRLPRACAISAPSSAAMAPSPAGTAFCMAWPRSFSSRAASATEKAPAAASAVVFAERVAGDDDGLLAQGEAALLLQHAQHGERVRHQRGLGVLGQRQLLAGPFEHQLGELLLQGLVDLLEHLAGGGEGGGEVAAHADGLAALAREDEGVNRHAVCSRKGVARRGSFGSPDCQWSVRHVAQPVLLRRWSVISGGQLKRTGTPHDPAPTDV